MDNITISDLFAEKCKLFEEREKLEREKKQMAHDYKQLKNELTRMWNSVTKSNEKLISEQKVFKKQLDILYDGFDKLNKDRKAFENEKANLQLSVQQKSSEKKTMYFYGCTDMTSIRKRYRDLLKIYHPDNLHGDHNIVDMINTEYNEVVASIPKYMSY